MPISLLLLILFTMVTIHAATKFETEKKTFSNIDETYELEVLLLNAYEDLEVQYKNNKGERNGQLQYDRGYVKYSLLSEKEDSYVFSFECYSDEGELYMELKMPKQ